MKQNKYGSATFIPASKVKPKHIHEEYTSALENVPGYIGTLDSVIKTKSAFKNVVSSLAGNVLLFEDIEFRSYLSLSNLCY